MQLQRLTGLERQKILDELAALLATIERLRGILSSEKLVMEIIVQELRAEIFRYRFSCLLTIGHCRVLHARQDTSQTRYPPP